MNTNQELRVLDNREYKGVCGDCGYFRRNKYCTFNPPQVIPNLTNGQYPVVKADSPSCDKHSRWDKSVFVNLISSTFSTGEILNREFVLSMPYTGHEHTPDTTNEAETKRMEDVLHTMSPNPYIVGSVPFLHQLQPDIKSTGFGRASYYRVFIGRLGLSFLPSHALILGAWLMHVAASTGYLDSGLTSGAEKNLDGILEFTSRIMREYGPTMEADSTAEAISTRVERYAILHAPVSPIRREDRFTSPLARMLEKDGMDGLYSGMGLDQNDKPVKPS